MAKRIIYLDIAKAICIILVVIGHFNPQQSPIWWKEIVKFIYSFHMPLFLFASGLIYISTKKAEQTYLSFIKNKVFRLMIPYFSASAIIIILKLLAGNNIYVENPKTMMSFIRMMYLPEAGYFLWYIWAIWWMFLILPGFKTKQSRMILFLASLVLHYLPFTFTEVFCLEQFRLMFVFFMSGVVCHDWKTLLTHFNNVHFSVYIILFVIFYVLDTFTQLGQFTYGASIIIPLLGIAATIATSRAIEQKAKNINTLMTVSASSYFIYLFHTTFEGFTKGIFFKVFTFDDMSNSLIFSFSAIIIIACGVGIPILLYRFVVSRTRATRIMFGIK